MMLVVHELEVLVLIRENARRAAADHKLRQLERRARELQVRLLEMIEVQVAVPAAPDELAGLEIALLREQVCEQRVAGDVERYPNENVRAALVELTGQPPGGRVELEERVTGHEAHALELAHVPGADHDATRIGVGPEALDGLGDLVDGASVGCRPGTPLPAVDRAQLAVLIRPFVPDRDVVFAQPGDVGVATQEPQQLVDQRPQVDLPGGDQREAAAEIEAHLVRKHRQGAGAGPVTLAHALGPDPAHQLQVLFHCAMAKLPEGARTRYAHTSSAPPAMIIGADSACPSVSQPPAR